MNADTSQTWAPDSCTLSPAGRLIRAEEFGQVFTETVREVDRAGPTRLHLELEPGPGPAARVAALTAAETECCSFFTFTMTVAAGRLTLDVDVPTAHVAVLDGLARRAADSIAPAR